jgi:hypothetical protein
MGPKRCWRRPRRAGRCKNLKDGHSGQWFDGAERKSDGWMVAVEELETCLSRAKLGLGGVAASLASGLSGLAIVFGHYSSR